MAYRVKFAATGYFRAPGANTFPGAVGSRFRITGERYDIGDLAICTNNSGETVVITDAGIVLDKYATTAAYPDGPIGVGEMFHFDMEWTDAGGGLYEHKYYLNGSLVYSTTTSDTMVYAYLGVSNVSADSWYLYSAENINDATNGPLYDITSSHQRDSLIDIKGGEDLLPVGFIGGISGALEYYYDWQNDAQMDEAADHSLVLSEASEGLNMPLTGSYTATVVYSDDTTEDLSGSGALTVAGPRTNGIVSVVGSDADGYFHYDCNQPPGTTVVPELIKGKDGSLSGAAAFTPRVSTRTVTIGVGMDYAELNDYFTALAADVNEAVDLVIHGTVGGGVTLLLTDANQHHKFKTTLRGAVPYDPANHGNTSKLDVSTIRWAGVMHGANGGLHFEGLHLVADHSFSAAGGSHSSDTGSNYGHFLSMRDCFYHDIGHHSSGRSLFGAGSSSSERVVMERNICYSKNGSAVVSSSGAGGHFDPGTVIADNIFLKPGIYRSYYALHFDGDIGSENVTVANNIFLGSDGIQNDWDKDGGAKVNFIGNATAGPQGDVPLIDRTGAFENEGIDYRIKSSWASAQGLIGAGQNDTDIGEWAYSSAAVAPALYEFSGQVSVIATVSGASTKVSLNLGGVDVSAAGAGQLFKIANLSGDAGVDALGAGSSTKHVDVAGNAVVNVNVSGSFTDVANEIHAFAGGITITASASGSATKEVILSGSATATATTASHMAKVVPMGGNVPVQTTAQGWFSKLANVAGGVTATVTTAASALKRALLSGMVQVNVLLSGRILNPETAVTPYTSRVVGSVSRIRVVGEVVSYRVPAVPQSNLKSITITGRVK